MEPKVALSRAAAIGTVSRWLDCSASSTITHLLVAAIGRSRVAVDELNAGRIAAVRVVARRRRDQTAPKWLHRNWTIAQGEEITEVQYVYGRRSGLILLIVVIVLLLR